MRVSLYPKEQPARAAVADGEERAAGRGAAEGLVVVLGGDGAHQDRPLAQARADRSVSADRGVNQ
jgi:hypothetical protein